MKLGFAAADALEIKDVVDEADEAVGVADGYLEHLLALLGARGECAAGEEAEGSADGGERRAELVGDGGDELVLHTVQGAALGGVGEGYDDAYGFGFALDRTEFRSVGGPRSRRGSRCRPCARRPRRRRGRCRGG